MINIRPLPFFRGRFAFQRMIVCGFHRLPPVAPSGGRAAACQRIRARDLVLSGNPSGARFPSMPEQPASSAATTSPRSVA